jgi:YesN/AraC family two-component response regulator
MKNAVNELLLSKVTLLIAEDDENTLNGLEALLKRYFKDIAIAKDGEEALAIYKKKRFDIILTDISMPNMNGIELGTRVKEIDSDTQVVFMTAHSESDTILEAIEAGADAFTVKPLEVKKILATLSKVAKVVTAHKYANQTHKLVQHILDVQDNIVILTDGKKISSANKRLLDFLGFDTLKEFTTKYNCICELFIVQRGFIYKQDDKSWIKEILDNKGISKVKMYNKDSGVDDEFIVKVSPFSHLESNIKFVVSFTDITS